MNRHNPEHETRRSTAGGDPEGYVQKVSSEKMQLWKRSSPALRRLDMELTERCNNDCIHCYINLPPDEVTARAGELSTSEIQKVMEEAASLGCLTVQFTGGEPLLRADFEEIYVCARKLGLKVLILTNATLITSRLASLFSRIPPLEKIEVSVYGMSRTSYESVTRVPGSFEAAWQGIHLLLEANVPFGVRTAMLPPNQEELEAFEAWAKTIPWMDEPVPYTVLLDLRCRRKPASRNRLIKQLRASPEQALSVFTRNRESYVQEMRRFCSQFVGPPGNRLFPCEAGIDSGCVDAYGHFQPCMMIRHPAAVYDLKVGSLHEALTNFFPKLRAMRATNGDYLARCARCFLAGLCEQCPGKSWLEHGTLDTPVDYFCEIAHAQARCFGLLSQRENGWQVRNWQDRIASFSGGRYGAERPETGRCSLQH